MAQVNPSKYDPLTHHLQTQSDVVKMKFADIERVIGAKLPPSAQRNRAYWSNNGANSVLTQAWLAAGFRSEQVDLAGRKLVFRRIAHTDAQGAGGFAETPAAAFEAEATSTPKPSLFGCLAGTVVVHGDLTEAADPTLAAYLDEIYGPAV